MSKINDSSKFSNICKSPSLYYSKSNLEINDEFTKSKINEIKNDLLLFKNNEIRDEIKIELNVGKRKQNSIKIEQDDEINNNYFKKIKEYAIKNKGYKNLSQKIIENEK